MSALTKGFRILEAVTANGSGLSFSEIVDGTGVPKASAHRLLRELVDLAALSYDDSTRRYRGGLLLAGLGASVTRNYDVRRVARPHLEALHASTGKVTTLGIRDGDQGIYIDKIEPADLVIRLHSEIGKSFPLHSTAMGKVLLAYSDAETVARVTRRKLRAYTEHTITDRHALRTELETVAGNGFAVDREEITRGLVCVAAPIRSVTGDVNAAMSCTFSSFDATPERIDELARQVLAGAEAASHQGKTLRSGNAET
ncbi:MAG: IclR family transcriptional regulator, partial [Pseudomonadota bacterium]